MLMNLSNLPMRLIQVSSSDLPGDKSVTNGVHFASAITNIGDQDRDGVIDIAVGASMEGYWSDT